MDAGEWAPAQDDFGLEKEHQVGSHLFNLYYFRQLRSVFEGENNYTSYTECPQFLRFKEVLVTKLPVTFRVNPSLHNHQQLKA